MSSLAAARADNFYYPPGWRPEMGGINKFQKSHPLGKRAKDIKDGILVVRFEMPFDVWCTHCETHIGRGVRYNAKKTKVGMYHSTILYEFALKCATCQGIMLVQNDPQACGYKLVSGIRKKTQVDDIPIGSHDDETIEALNAPEVGIAMAADPFFKLEHDKKDRTVAKKRAVGLESLLALNDKVSDQYQSNANLRASFRAEKKVLKRKADEARRLNVSIPLVDVHIDDVVAAKTAIFTNLSKRAKTTVTTARRPATKDPFANFGGSSSLPRHSTSVVRRR
ncbi:hypothetical protein SDRG_03373 [Saprolegnia diclina VS20]|uniref:Coiled-coil domain-containing protein 130 n=1 Tax=Saprolegnia diclina (strain VS20) TaxID=1156394 RepID=T0S919_SAPDV|nr:hypothetical protein SDRG_03373 [Saprolegnia diclina VS20]EQC39167.1 hypothetical protein SDRG_03373 [Saprolegnia diclina VS20]|eukprot:XP_008607228.1 hypothetical protein SDRG_03373 [Saprolegnia diclina VS20]